MSKSFDFYNEKFSRNGLRKNEQEKIRTSVFCIVGLGGTGGVVFENLVRIGAENFVLFEDDRIELSNFNRQILADERSLDMEKASSAVLRAKSINPKIRIVIKGKFGSKSTLSGCNVVIDCTDNVQSKIIVSRAALKVKIPYVFCSSNDTRGIISVFEKYLFEKAFGIEKGSASKYKTCSTILCPSVMISGSIAASFAVNYLLKKNFVKAPEALFFDLSREDVFWRAKLG